MPFNLPISIDKIDPDEILALTANSAKNHCCNKDKEKFLSLQHAECSAPVFEIMKFKNTIHNGITKDEIKAGIHEIYFSEEDWDE